MAAISDPISIRFRSASSDSARRPAPWWMRASALRRGWTALGFSLLSPIRKPYEPGLGLGQLGHRTREPLRRFNSAQIAHEGFGRECGKSLPPLDPGGDQEIGVLRPDPFDARDPRERGDPIQLF